MCIICYTEWHNVPDGEYKSFWDFYRAGHEFQPPWEKEEAWHSDIPKGKAGALVDRHPFAIHYDLWRLSWQTARDQDWIRARMARLRSMWQPTRTEQTFLD